METLTSISEREDFVATSDPALEASADRGKANLLTYKQLYELWERQHWATEENLTDSFNELFDRMLKARVDRLAAEPEDTEVLVEAITLYHMIIEGALALTGQHYIIEYNTRMGTLPGFVEGFSNVARDEHRHIAFGVRFLTDMVRDDPRHRAAMQRTMAEALPVADQVLDPPCPEEEDSELFGASREATHDFAAQSLTRRLKVIGLA